jgi:hypothetical protein
MEELKLKNRIALLSSRQTDNGKIIKKLERRLRKLQNKT